MNLSLNVHYHHLIILLSSDNFPRIKLRIKRSYDTNWQHHTPTNNNFYNNHFKSTSLSFIGLHFTPFIGNHSFNSSQSICEHVSSH